jgi:uncharacterized protein (TIGR00266 family)
MKAWYAAQQGRSLGPFTREELVARLSEWGGPSVLVYGPGTVDWTPAGRVPGLLDAAPGAPPPPPVRAGADEVDYTIHGDDMQYVEVVLDPGETVIAEAGNMMHMTEGIQMETVFGDPAKNQGMFEKLLDAGKRVVTGESLFLTTFTAASTSRETVAFAGPYPGKILPFHLDQLGGEILCQKDSFLAAARGIDVGIAFQRKILAGLFGGEGFILQRLRGNGVALLHAGGGILARELRAGETLRVDTGCVVAFQPSVNYDVKLVGGIKNSLFGGEGLFLTTLTGPGKVWLQSLPFSRLAARLLAGARSGKEDGSIIGGLGRLFEAR